MKKARSFICVLLSAALCLGLLPTGAMAEDGSMREFVFEKLGELFCCIIREDEGNETIADFYQGQRAKIEMELPEESYITISTPENAQKRVPLANGTAYSACGLRSGFEELFGTTKNEYGEKQGCIFAARINGADALEQDSTMRSAFRNKYFIEKYWYSKDVRDAVAELAQTAYVDVAKDSADTELATLNAYFDLAAEQNGDDKSFEGDRVLTREQFYTLVCKAAFGAEGLESPEQEMTEIGGHEQYAPYVRKVAPYGWLSAEDGSLGADNISQPITQMEALYLITNVFFACELPYTAMTKNSKVFKYGNGGDLLHTIGGNNESSCPARSNNLLAYMMSSNERQLDENAYRSAVTASRIGVCDGLEIKLFEPVTKQQSLQMLVNAFMAANELFGFETITEYCPAAPAAEHEDANEQESGAAFSIDECCKMLVGSLSGDLSDALSQIEDGSYQSSLPDIDELQTVNQSAPPQRMSSVEDFGRVVDYMLENNVLNYTCPMYYYNGGSTGQALIEEVFCAPTFAAGGRHSMRASFFSELSGYGLDYYNGMSVSFSLNPNDGLSTAQALEQMELSEDYASSLIECLYDNGVLRENMTYKTKAGILYDFVIDYLEYDYSLEQRSVYDALTEQLVVCQGYAALYCLLCNLAGVPSEDVVGKVGEDYHEWTRLCINGQWLHMDPTFGDGDGGRKWFWISEEKMVGEYDRELFVD